MYHFVLIPFSPTPLYFFDVRAKEMYANQIKEYNSSSYNLHKSLSYFVNFIFAEQSKGLKKNFDRLPQTTFYITEQCLLWSLSRSYS